MGAPIGGQPGMPVGGYYGAAPAPYMGGGMAPVPAPPSGYQGGCRHHSSQALHQLSLRQLQPQIRLLPSSLRQLASSSNLDSLTAFSSVVAETSNSNNKSKHNPISKRLSNKPRRTSKRSSPASLVASLVVAAATLTAIVPHRQVLLGNSRHLSLTSPPVPSACQATLYHQTRLLH